MSTAAAAAVQRNPFPGLRPFREDEEYLFFGRENQVDAMVDKLAATRFLAVVGTSGSGKSSLVNCGLRPALHQGLMPRAGTAWRIAQFRPGGDPLKEMARALAQNGVLFRDYAGKSVSLVEIVDTTLRTSKLGLVDIYEQAHLADDVNLLVVVDQFEELFRFPQLGAGRQAYFASVSEEATAFVNLLLAAKEQTTCPIYVVLTMRSDFFGDCAQFAGLAEAINAGQYLVPRMTRDERRLAINGPVAVGGAEISPVLLTRLVNDVGDNPDQLSILQHALNRTWARWQHEGSGRGPVDLAHYEAIGGMAHALDQHAERAYAELGTERQQQICEKLFKALTDKATDPRGTRRPTNLGTLCALADATAAEITEVIDVFRQPSRSFLMPPAGETLEAKTVIDISHESLLRVWRRLGRWADEERRSAWEYRHLAETAERHAAGKASLWRDPDLQLALDWRDQNQPNETWASRYHPGFAAAMRFLTQSGEAREAERAERARAVKRKRTWVAAGVVAALFLVGGFAAWQSKVADDQRAAALRAKEALIALQAAVIAKAEAKEQAVRAQIERLQQEAVFKTRQLNRVEWLAKVSGEKGLREDLMRQREQLRRELDTILLEAEGAERSASEAVSERLHGEELLRQAQIEGARQTELDASPAETVSGETVVNEKKGELAPADKVELAGIKYKDLSVCEQFDQLTSDGSEGVAGHGLQWQARVSLLANLETFLERSAVVVTQNNFLTSSTKSAVPKLQETFRPGERVYIHIWASVASRQKVWLEYIDGNGTAVPWGQEGSRKKSFHVPEYQLRGHRLGYRIWTYRVARPQGPRPHEFRLYNEEGHLLCRRSFEVVDS